MRSSVPYPSIVFQQKGSHSNFRDLEAVRFERLRVLGFAGRCGHAAQWFCECDCGCIVRVGAAALLNKRTQSCGCLQRERHIERATTHGGAGSVSYGIWEGVRQRCRNPRNPAYKNYGGRGLDLCDRWEDYAKFREDMGEPPTGWQLERIDNDKGYSPENCKWADRKTQNRNKRTNRLLTFQGKTQPVAQWADDLNISYSTLFCRLHIYKWSVEKCLTEPVGKRRTNHDPILFQGQTLTLAQWSSKVGISVGVLRYRIWTLGWSMKKAIATPVQVHTRRKGQR